MEEKQAQPFFKKTAILMAAVGFLGLLDSSYLAAEHYLGRVPPCSIFSGCDLVTTSKYATIGGVSVALLGAIYYFSVLILSIVYLETKKQSLIDFLARFVWVGFLASLWFVLLQAFVIKSFCLYCLFSALTSTVIFAAGLSVRRGLKKQSTISSLQEF